MISSKSQMNEPRLSIGRNLDMVNNVTFKYFILFQVFSYLFCFILKNQVALLKEIYLDMRGKEYTFKR